MTWFLGCWQLWHSFFIPGQSSSTGWAAVTSVWFTHAVYNSHGAPRRPQQWGQPGVQFCYCSRRPTSNPITHSSCASSSFPPPLLPLLCDSRRGFVIIGGSKSGWVAPSLGDQRKNSMRWEPKRKYFIPTSMGRERSNHTVSFLPWHKQHSDIVHGTCLVQCSHGEG